MPGCRAVTTFPGRRKNADLIEKTFKEEFWRAAQLVFGPCAWLLIVTGSLPAPAGPGDWHGQWGHPSWELGTRTQAMPATVVALFSGEKSCFGGGCCKP